MPQTSRSRRRTTKRPACRSAEIPSSVTNSSAPSRPTSHPRCRAIGNRMPERRIIIRDSGRPRTDPSLFHGSGKSCQAAAHAAPLNQQPVRRPRPSGLRGRYGTLVADMETESRALNHCACFRGHSDERPRNMSRFAERGGSACRRAIGPGRLMPPCEDGIRLARLL